jgi:hypothetical protein
MWKDRRPLGKQLSFPNGLQSIVGSSLVTH